MKLTPNKKRLIVASGLCLMAACGFFYLDKPSDPISMESYSPKILGDRISGVSKNTNVKLSYIYSENIIEEEIRAKNGVVASIVNEEASDQDKYAVHYSLQSTDLKYIDIEFNINKRSNRINTVVSGLDPAEKVSLVINKQHYFKDTPSDWAGKIELTTNLNNTLENNEICLRVGQKAQMICHLTPIEDNIKDRGAA